MAASNTVDLYKFPRTKHLFDAGGSGVSREDLLMDKGEESLFYSGAVDSGGGGKTGKGRTAVGRRVVVEEKVDGANLGISIGSDLRLQAQNRSHFVTSSTHKQFSPLDTWLETHSSALFEVMQPERHVLFGEWLYAKHSIHYTRLPDYFLAFDLYDRRAGVFCSSVERDRLLKDTGISTVRTISAGTALSSRDDVRRLMAHAPPARDHLYRSFLSRVRLSSF